MIRAKPTNKKGQLLRRNQQRLFAHLQSAKQNFEIRYGYMMGSGGYYHEKGVDVWLAVDLIVGAYENLYDTAIIMSSDTDLIPAIPKVKLLNKNIEYIGFAHQPSLGLQEYSTVSRLLIKEDVESFEQRILL